jgi:transcriptional regulator with XRE-family HTH domain
MGRKPLPKPQHLPAKLRAIRENFGLSQYRLARLLQVGPTRLSEFEWGRRMPSWIVLLRYARLAGLPLEFIVDDDIKLDYFKRNLAVVDQRRGELTDLVHECVVLFSPT